MVSIAAHPVGKGHPVYVIAEIGLNHNGDVEIAKRLIDVAAEAGAQAVKFQKRTPLVSTPEHMRDPMGHHDLPRLPVPRRIRSRPVP